MKNFWSTVFRMLLVALIINVALYFIGVNTGIMRQDLEVPAGASQITLMPVMVSTTVGILGALLLFALIKRFVRNTFRVFSVVTLILLFLSFMMPLVLPMPTSMMIYLNLMHVSVAASALYFLGKYWHKKQKLPVKRP